MWWKFLLFFVLTDYVKCFGIQNGIDPIMCLDLPKRINQAEHKINERNELTEKLQALGVAVRDGEPASGFFSGLPLSDNTVRQSYYSEVALRLSQYVGFDLYGHETPRFANFDPMLAKYTKCVQRYFNDFCRKGSVTKCNPNSAYPEINAICRNLLAPKNGAAETPYNTMIYQFYQDSIQSVRKSMHMNVELPSPRVLINNFFDNCNPFVQSPDIIPNLGGSMFGQLITHDVSFRLGTQLPRGGNGIACCTRDNSRVLPSHLLHPTCLPIRIPRDDKFFGPLNMTCMNFIRTQTVVNNECTMSTRKQLNLATSSLDLSIIYGHIKENTDRVRLFRGGLLKLNKNGVLAEDNEGYVLADERTTQHPILALLHSLFIREHNRVATLISKMRPHYDDEKIFQEARRFVVAEYQNIVYNEWLPIFAGTVQTNYNNTKHFDYSTTSEFAHAAFRYLHSNIPNDLFFFNESGRVVNTVKFSQSMGNMTYIENQYDDVARSLFYQTIDISGCLDEVKNRVFPNEQGIGIDLLSTDINRGRDHGVAPYYIFVRLCHGKIVSTFLDLYPLISYENIWKLEKLYKSVFDVDLYVGSALETKSDTGFFPPTTQCLVNEQFQRYRNGDRYFFDHPQNPNPFKAGQLLEIQKSSFARLVCDNTNVKYVPLNSFYAFTRNSAFNPRVSCSKIPKVRILI